MKREDSKKHYKEEKHDLKKEAILSSILIVLLVFSNLYAQIPINGFCRYREFSVKPNFTNLSAIDYSSDGYRDLLIYNSSSNQYLTLNADSKSNFGNPSLKSSSLALSMLHSLGNEQNGKRFLALSRKTREVCEITFSKSGNFSINSKIKLNGFASSIDVGEINSDNKFEALVAGAALDGLKILKTQNNRLTETENIKGKIFSQAVFVDLNSDQFMNLAAFDLVSNSIIFFSNNGLGDFNESHSINVGANITEFHANDINSDGFTDLTFINNGKLQIICGDSVSSFQKKINLPVEQTIDKYTVLDFNGDGYNDVAFINKSTGSLYISYAKGTNQYYPPILYLKKNGLCDLVSYVDRGGRKLAALSSDGKVFLINTLSFQDEQFSISIGESPEAVQAFDYGNDNFKDIAFIDSGNNSLKIGLSERRNLFRSLIEVALSSQPTKFVVEDNEKNIKTFFCYSDGGRSIEVVRYNFTNRKSQKLFLYTNKPISEIKILSDRLRDKVNVYALTKEDDKIYLQNLEIRDFHLADDQTIGIALNAAKAILNFSVYRDVYYVSNSNTNIDLIRASVDRKVLENTYCISFKKKPDELMSISFAAISELFNRYKPAAALLSLKRNSILYFFLENGNIRMPLQNYVGATLPLKYIIDNDDAISFLAYDDISGKLFHLETLVKEKRVKESALLEMKGINDYVATKLDVSNRFIICANKFQNSITFKKF